MFPYFNPMLSCDLDVDGRTTCSHSIEGVLGLSGVYLFTSWCCTSDTTKGIGGGESNVGTGSGGVSQENDPVYRKDDQWVTDRLLTRSINLNS